jgi:hypothetical protein
MCLQLEAQTDGRLFKMFPNLEGYKIVIFENSEKIKYLYYEPPLVDFDQEKFESQLLSTNQSTKYLEIGREEWIVFWKKVIDSFENLKEMYNCQSGDIKELVQLLVKSKQYFRSVTICTDNVGRTSVEEMELPSTSEDERFYVINLLSHNVHNTIDSLPGTVFRNLNSFCIATLNLV